MDPVGEAWATLNRRPGRTLLSALASAFGIGVLVLTAGLTSTLSQTVAAEFDALRATEVVVTPMAGAPRLPPDAESSVTRIDGVRSAGLIVSLGSSAVRRTTIDLGEPPLSVEMIAASPDALVTLGITFSSGRLYDAFHTERWPNVAIVGKNAAQRLGLAPADGTASISIDGTPYLLIGIADSVLRRPGYAGSIFIPIVKDIDAETAGGVEELLIETEPGAATVVALQAPVAIKPTAPTDVQASAPPDPKSFRRTIEANLQAALLAIGATVLIIGLFGIGNAAFVSVLERTTEIGVLRSIGARPAHIWLQITVETALVGAIGGVIGTSLAVTALVMVSAQQGWSPTMDQAVPLAGPLAGAVMGTIAGILPARRAIRVQPLEALRL